MCGGVLRIFTGLYFLSISTCFRLFFFCIGWVLIVWERGFGSGLCPGVAGESRIGADFFVFESAFWRNTISPVVVRMGGDRRFASLLRIGGPSGMRKPYIKLQTH